MSRYEHPLSQEEQEELMAYADGELPESMIPDAARHLEACVDCSRAAGEAKRLSHTMTQWEIEEAPPSLTAAVMAEIQDVRRQSSARAVTVPWWRRQYVWTYGFYGLSGSVAAVVLVLVMFPSLLGRSYSGADLKSIIVADHSRQELLDEANFPAEVEVPTRERLKSRVELAVSPSPPAGGRQGATAAGGGGGGPAEPDGAMIVRTVFLKIIAKDFEKGRSEIDAIVRDARGYIEQLQLSGGKGTARVLSATLRLPANQLESGLTSLRRTGQVQDESQNSSDVSSQYVDLAARLKNGRNTEQRLLTMLRERTGELKDVVEAEREVSRVREEIERMDAQLQGLSKKVAFASVQINLTEEFQAKLNDEPRLPSTRTRLGNAAVNGYQLASEAVLSIVLFVLMYGPTLTLLATALSMAALLAWRLQKRVVVKQG